MLSGSGLKQVALATAQLACFSKLPWNGGFGRSSVLAMVLVDATVSQRLAESLATERCGDNETWLPVNYCEAMQSAGLAGLDRPEEVSGSSNHAG